MKNFLLVFLCTVVRFYKKYAFFETTYCMLVVFTCVVDHVNKNCMEHRTQCCHTWSVKILPWCVWRNNVVSVYSERTCRFSLGLNATKNTHYIKNGLNKSCWPLNFIKKVKGAYVYLPQEWSYGLQRLSSLKYYDVRGRSDKYLAYKWKTKILEKWQFISEHNLL